MKQYNVTFPKDYYQKEGVIFYRGEKITNATFYLLDWQKRLIQGEESRQIVIVKFVIAESETEIDVEIPISAIKTKRIMNFLPEEFLICGLSENKKIRFINECINKTLMQMTPRDVVVLSTGYNQVGAEYLYNLGGILLGTEGDISDYVVRDSLKLKAYTDPSDNFLKWIEDFCMLDKEIMPTLFLSVMASLLRPYLQEVGIDTSYVTYVVGETGCGKSTSVKLLTEIYENESNYRTVSSGLPEVRKQMLNVHDFVFLLDDLNKTETFRVKVSKEAKVSELIQQVANYDLVEARGECSKFDGMLIITAEYVLHTESTCNRCIVLNIASDLNMRAVGHLKDTQSQYIAFLKRYITWLCTNRELLIEFIKILSVFSSATRTYNAEAYKGIKRLERSERILHISMEFLVRFLEERKMPKHQIANCRLLFEKSIQNCMDDTRELIRKQDVDIGKEYIEVIIKQFVINIGNVEESYKSYKNKRKKSDEEVFFFRDDDCFCITGDDLVRLFTTEGNFEYACSKKAISNQLRYHGFLKIQGGECSFPSKMAGGKLRFYHIYVKRIVESMSKEQLTMARCTGTIRELRERDWNE